MFWAISLSTMNLSTHSLFTKNCFYFIQTFSHIQRSSGPDKDLTPPVTTESLQKPPFLPANCFTVEN